MEDIDSNVGFSMTSPLPYVLVTSADKEGRANVLGVSWVTKLSFDPFLMAVSIGHTRYSHDLIKNSGEFVICYPSAEQSKQALYCGFHSGRCEDKFARSGLAATPSRKVKPPTIEGCTVAFECRLFDSHEVGDHTLFVGEVVAVTGDPERPYHTFVTVGQRPIAMGPKGNVRS
ncbi:MAG: flavin reductase family protein [Methanomassiliicoccus sp.]|nr:flavin reductase family protein [Methanomassiliicoccus sp.]